MLLMSSEAQFQPVENATPAHLASAQKTPPPFHWTQLDAPDFATFVKNLRAVGCPEATIRDIVHGELTEIYAAKRQEAETQLATAPEIEREVLRENLQELAVEESSLLASLTNGSSMPALGDTAPPLPAVNPAQAGTPAAFEEISELGASQQDGTVLTPAAFMVGNDASQSGARNEISVTPTDPTLDATTAQVITRLRQDFAQSLEGAGNDASSLFYRQQWLSAQRASDEVYSSLFGGEAFARAQAEAMQKQHQAQAR